MIILSIVIGALITATPDSNTTGDDIDGAGIAANANDGAGIAVTVTVCLIVAAVCYIIAGLSLVRAGTLRHKISASLGGTLLLAIVRHRPPPPPPSPDPYGSYARTASHVIQRFTHCIACKNCTRGRAPLH